MEEGRVVGIKEEGSAGGLGREGKRNTNGHYWKGENRNTRRLFLRPSIMKIEAKQRSDGTKGVSRPYFFVVLFFFF